MGRSGKVAVFAAAVLSGCLGLASVSKAADVTFEAQIKPIFKESCVKCHHVDEKHKASAGLDLATLEATLKGGKHKDDVVAGNADKSLLYKVLLGPATLEGNKKVDAMPKQKRGEEFKAIDKDKIELIKAWIDGGAK